MDLRDGTRVLRGIILNHAGWPGTPRDTLSLGGTYVHLHCATRHTSKAQRRFAARNGAAASTRRSEVRPSPGSTTMTSGSRTCRPAPNWCRQRWERRTSGHGPHSAGSSGGRCARPIGAANWTYWRRCRITPICRWAATARTRAAATGPCCGNF